MFWYEDDVLEVEAKPTRTSDGKAPFLFYGSSSFKGWDGDLDEDMGVPTLNRAFGGSTLAA